jgi:hypothetical protein
MKRSPEVSYPHAVDNTEYLRSQTEIPVDTSAWDGSPQPYREPEPWDGWLTVLFALVALFFTANTMAVLGFVIGDIVGYFLSHNKDLTFIFDHFGILGAFIGLMISILVVFVSMLFCVVFLAMKKVLKSLVSLCLSAVNSLRR